MSGLKLNLKINKINVRMKKVWACSHDFMHCKAFFLEEYLIMEMQTLLFCVFSLKSQPNYTKDIFTDIEKHSCFEQWLMLLK